MPPLDPSIDCGTTERDGQGIEDVQLELLPDSVHELRRKLHQKAKAEPEFRFYALYDRVVQMAVLLILEPIFEADFMDCSYGFRPWRNAHDALEAIRANLKSGRAEVYDADLKGYSDSIPHDKLMACVRMRIVDGSVLKLIRMWLKAPIIETDGKGRMPPPKKNQGGTPQGGVISPLLANVCLHWFDRQFHRKADRDAGQTPGWCAMPTTSRSLPAIKASAWMSG